MPRAPSQVAWRTYVQNELLELSEEAVSVVEHAVEAQHFAVHLKELSKLVEVRRRLRHLDRLSFNTRWYVRVSGTLLHAVDNYTLTLQPVLDTHRSTQPPPLSRVHSPTRPTHTLHSGQLSLLPSAAFTLQPVVKHIQTHSGQLSLLPSAAFTLQPVLHINTLRSTQTQPPTLSHATSPTSPIDTWTHPGQLSLLPSAAFTVQPDLHTHYTQVNSASYPQPRSLSSQ